MSESPDLAHLAARCAEHPDRLAFAALAEGLRKRGDRAEARATVEAGLALHPDHLPALVVLARILTDEGDHLGAEAALHRSLRIDPSHPVVLEAFGGHQSGRRRPGGGTGVAGGAGRIAARGRRSWHRRDGRGRQR